MRRHLAPRPAAVAALAVAVGCAPVARFGPRERAAVAEVLAAQQAAWNRGDLEAYMAGYLRSEALVFTSGGKIRRGWQDALDHYRARYGGDRAGMGQLAFELLEVTPLGADGCVVLGRWQLTSTPQAAAGVFSVVLARTAAGWRIVHDHTSVEPPAP